MANMGFLLNDKTTMDEYLLNAFNRRRQLCPFPLELDELIDVQHSPPIASTVRSMVNWNAKALHWDNMAKFLVDDPEHPAGVLQVRVHLNATIPLAVSARGPVESYAMDLAEVVRCWNGPATAKLREWAWKATQIELENRWAMKITKALTKKATTHQQVHRYMPELYTLLANQEEARPDRTSWMGRRFAELAKALNELGSERAQRIVLEGVTVKDRSNLKSLVVHTLLLQPHQGIGKSTEFDQTWVEP